MWWSGLVVDRPCDSGGYRAIAVAALGRLARSIWLRVLVSVALLVLVATRIDLGVAADRLSEGSWGYFLAAVIALFTSFVVGALRWHVFLSATDIDAPSLGVVRAYLIGTFTNNFLPSQIGGDVTRTWVVSRPGTRIRAGTTVVCDRAMALACLIAVAWLAYATNASDTPIELVVALATCTAAAMVVGAGAALVFQSERVRRRMPVRLHRPGREVRAAARACTRGVVLRRTFLIGLGFQGLVVLSTWLVALSFGLSVPFATLAVCLAPVLIVSVLPISIGGFGVREASYVVLLGYAGVSATDAALLSLASAAAFAIASLPGALALIKRPAVPVSSADAGR